MKTYLIPQRFGQLDRGNRAQVAKLVRMANSKFRLSAKRWEQGQNSGSSEYMAAMDRASERYGSEGQAMLAPLGIKCTWAGLYPVYEVGGFTEYSALAAVLAALGHPRGWLKEEDCK